MPIWLNQNSFLVAGAAALIAAAVLLVRDGVRPSDVVALAVLAVGVGIVYTWLRPRPGTASNADLIRAQIGVGQPVLLEFQSPY
jgi:hypothetical protein